MYVCNGSPAYVTGLSFSSVHCHTCVSSFYCGDTGKSSWATPLQTGRRTITKAKFYQDLITMDLCHSCHAFAASFCSNLHLGKSLNSFHHFASLSGLSERTKYCRLCYHIEYHASKALHNTSWSLYNNALVKIFAERSGYMEHKMKGPASEFKVLIEPSHSADVFLTGAIWASSGSFSQCPLSVFWLSYFDQVALPPNRAS